MHFPSDESLYADQNGILHPIDNDNSDAFADLFWQTRCLKMETRTVTPDGKQWVRGRRRLKE